MKSLRSKLFMAVAVSSLALIGSTNAEAQQLQRSYQSSPGDETWYLNYIGMSGNIECYSFNYRGTVISGGGRLDLHPNGVIYAKTTYISRNFLGAAIPVGSLATGAKTGFNQFYLDGFRLDGVVRRLRLY